MTHLKVETRKLQVKCGVVSWVLLYCECRFNSTTASVMYVVIFNLKSYFQLLMHQITTNE